MSGYFQREAEENEEREEYRDALERNYRELERDYAALEAEWDALRERCEKLEWLVEVQDFCWLSDIEDVQPISDDATGELHATWQAALAEAEVKP